MASASADNDKQQDPSEALVRLLCRALSRLAVAAHGIDKRLDEQLAELRQLLRRDIDDVQALALLVDAIDARIKDVGDERDRFAEIIQQSLQRMIEQLLGLKPAAEIASELKSQQKQLKQTLSESDQLRVLARLPVLQARALGAADDAGARRGLFARWMGRSASAVPARSEADHGPVDEVAPIEAEPLAQPAVPAADSPATQSETSFARISTAVCQVLDQLLRQIDPPPNASENYQHAREQIAKGLNWYELVSTLEEISVIVLAALERDQGDFQQFLQTINKRLGDAHVVLESSRQSQVLRQQADAELNEVVRLEVAEMQTSVAQATHLDGLKREIGSRLDSVVGAMDQHRLTEQQRQQELEQQLEELTARLREMETQSLAIEERMVEQQRLALLDSLTQLPNRQAYEQRLQQEYERWKRYGRPLAMAVCDIDHFKSINDNFGHLAGDRVLRIIAKTLAKRLRSSDFIARFGGEEFVILMPETDQDAALKTVEAIREAVASCPFHFREQPISITMSAGIAAFVEGVPSEQVFERADTALYQAKESGRNQCVVAA